jgi:hypothetical protein
MTLFGFFMPCVHAPELHEDPELEPLRDEELHVCDTFENNDVAIINQPEKNLDVDLLRLIDHKIIYWPYGKGHYKIREGCPGVCKIPNKVKESCCNRYAVIDIMNPRMLGLHSSITKIKIESHPVIENVNQIEGIKFVYYEEENIFDQTGICSTENIRETRLFNMLCFCVKEGNLTRPNATFR